MSGATSATENSLEAATATASESASPAIVEALDADAVADDSSDDVDAFWQALVQRSGGGWETYEVDDTAADEADDADGWP